MVRRGSTVRVRQRALQKARKAGLSLQIDLHTVQLDARMEQFLVVPDLSPQEGLNNGLGRQR
jgi:succinylglutamate desuccinylase